MRRRPTCGRYSACWRTRVGFTLMELLVVTTLLGLLAALLLPVLAQARDRGRTSACLANIHQIALAHILYVDDWDDQLPNWWQTGPMRPEPFRARRYWTEFLQPYLRSGAVLRDPGTMATEPSPRGVRLADYALLTWDGDGVGTPDSPHWHHPGPPLRLAEVRRPAETISVTDGATTTERTQGHVARHHGGMVAGFLDGHAQWLRPAEAFEVIYDPKGPYQANYSYRRSAADR